MPLSPPDLLSLADACREPPVPADDPARLFSIWEITSWILPMAPEHFRRVLAAEPDLPQGSAGTEGGTRWFTARDLGVLRAHFTPRARGGRYRPSRPEGALAPIIAMTGPQGQAGRSLALLHLASAAALAGWRVLVIDADPCGTLASRFRGETPGAVSGGVVSLIARAAARHLRRSNANRLDSGEPPLPMDDRLSAALGQDPAALIRPGFWPGLEVMAAPDAGLLADGQIAGWRMAQRGWQPWRALADAATESVSGPSLRQRYDLIFCDTGRGLGPLALSVLASADVLLAPLPLQPGGVQGLVQGLAGLAGAMEMVQAEAQTLARALGQATPALGWRRLAVLPTRAGPDGAQRLAGFAAKLPPHLAAQLLPDALPEIDLLAAGAVGQFYDLDYRRQGRLIYAPQREACEAAFRGLAGLVADLWQQEVSAQPALL